MLSLERREEAARTLLRIAGRDPHDDGAVAHVLNLATFRRRLYMAAERRLAAERDDLLRACNDLNPRARS